jgi:translocation protein SEC62
VRLLLSDAYKKKQKKNTLLPVVNDRDEAISAFRLLQNATFAIRVEKVSAHHGHGHDHDEQKKERKKKKKKKSDKPKPPQNLNIQRDQSQFSDDDYFAWFYENTQLQTILGGIGIVIVVFGAILFPLWPPVLRTGVWYLSMLALAFIAFIIVTAIVRLILFVITMFAIPPGIWLFPNLFADVGFFESFVPLWAWAKKPKGKKKNVASWAAPGEKGKVTASPPPVSGGGEKNLHTTVEDAPDED